MKEKINTSWIINEVMVQGLIKKDWDKIDSHVKTAMMKNSYGHKVFDELKFKMFEANPDIIWYMESPRAVFINYYLGCIYKKERNRKLCFIDGV